MKLPFKQFIISLSLIVIGLLFASSTHAFSLFPGEPSVVGNSVDYREYIVNFYVFALPATALVAVVLIMIGGVIWITSAGDQGRITKAKEFIINAIIGLVILSGIYVILGFINPALVILQPVSPEELGTFGACYLDADNTCRLSIEDDCNPPNQFREGQQCDDEVAQQIANEKRIAEFCANPANFEIPEMQRAQSTIQCHSPQNDFGSPGSTDFFAGELCRETHEYSFDEAEFSEQAEADCRTRCKSPCTHRFEFRQTGQMFCYCTPPSDSRFYLGPPGSSTTPTPELLEYIDSLKKDQ